MIEFYDDAVKSMNVKTINVKKQYLIASTAGSVTCSRQKQRQLLEPSFNHR